MKRQLAKILSLLLAVSLLTGCSDAPASSTPVQQSDKSVSASVSSEEAISSEENTLPDEETNNANEDNPPADKDLDSSGGGQEENDLPDKAPMDETLAEVSWSAPAYSGKAYAVINDNNPFFYGEDITLEVFESYSPLDGLGRCGITFANICRELMPTEDRESISHIKPTGWVQNRYDFVDGESLYNRCHLIGFQLAGENANDRNLITGTRYMNVQGMLPFENMVADYVKETGNHVLYRVTPIFEGSELVARGVLMEGWSVEDEGDGICFCVYCYNVQPGVEINYATGDNWAVNVQQPGDDTGNNDNNDEKIEDDNSAEGQTTYVLNTNSKKFHSPDCSSVEKMSEKNRKDYTGTREELIEQGYDPCGICDP